MLLALQNDIYQPTRRLNLFVGGTYSNPNTFNNLDLLINGNPSVHMNMFIEGVGPVFTNNSLPLFTAGPTVFAPDNSLSLPLSVEGGYANVNENLPLYIYGKDSVNVGVNLFIGNQVGSPESFTPTGRSLNLFIARMAAYAAELPLFIWGKQSITSGTPLYTSGTPVPIVGSLDLSIHGGSSVTGGIFLFTHGSLPANSGIPLSIPNVLGTGNAQLDMYIHGGF